MKSILKWAGLFPAVALLILAWAATSQPGGAWHSVLATVPAATPEFLQQAAGSLLPAPPSRSGAPPRGMLGTSVIPPGPATGELCSVDSSMDAVCSAEGLNDRCSAFNDNDNVCSALANLGLIGADIHCSASGANAACSVLPPARGGNPSYCSTVSPPGTGARCSALAGASRRLCSTKSAGASRCTHLSGSGNAACSVVPIAAGARGICSTKYDQAATAKACSSFVQPAVPGFGCSVQVGSTGVCTTFGAADPGSCSAFVTGAHCSVIEGPAGGPWCVQ